MCLRLHYFPSTEILYMWRGVTDFILESERELKQWLTWYLSSNDSWIMAVLCGFKINLDEHRVRVGYQATNWEAVCFLLVTKPAW